MSRQKMRVLNRTKKQSKFKQIISAPIKVLCKVRDCYMMGMDDCAGRAGYRGVVAGCSMVQVVPLPKCFNVNKYSFKASGHDDQELIGRKPFSGATIYHQCMMGKRRLRLVGRGVIVLV
ncbi:hypothetical protein Ddye_003396 [Dipteronia dyeriana]|uniref:Uncharacterized protein n=1 Tax=Dipteronia dyeriana TaxID=168575 RepID=A0AAD9XSR2_9ROSI|nr:hypothetical protein Ddye_003396 [Dipteronia dyeriana]